MNITAMQFEILKLLKLPELVTKIELTLEVDKIPEATVTYYPHSRCHHTRTATFECYGTHSQEITK